jgi:hypothetical protein
MVQGLSQMNGIHQGSAGLVFPIELVDAVAGNNEGGYHPIIEADTGQIAAVAEQERPQEDICGLVVLDGNHLLLEIIYEHMRPKRIDACGCL